MFSAHRPVTPVLERFALFVGEAVRDASSVGAVAPSSSRLARTLASSVHAHPNSRVLEVGAGTGSVTRAIARTLGPEGSLDVVEPNPRFARQLRDSMTIDPDLRGIGDRTRILEQPIQDLEPAERYDCIVTGLPFTNFDPELVERIMRSYLYALLLPGGELRYFTYRGAHHLRALFSSPSEVARHGLVTDVLDRYRRAHGVGTSTVWLNLPPAHVHTLHSSKEANR